MDYKILATQYLHSIPEKGTTYKIQADHSSHQPVEVTILDNVPLAVDLDDNEYIFLFPIKRKEEMYLRFAYVNTFDNEHGKTDCWENLTVSNPFDDADVVSKDLMFYLANQYNLEVHPSAINGYAIIENEQNSDSGMPY